MAQSQTSPTASAVADFQRCLAASDRVLALCGAGLSAASGLPTFRGPGGWWRQHDAVSLATPEAFARDPGLVWQFYSHRRHMALRARPNPAHHALAALARAKPNFLTLTQNVDGLSPRANHPPAQLHLLHGSLFDVKCSNDSCDYMEPNNLKDPLVPALAEPSHEPIRSHTDTIGPAAASSLSSATGLSSGDRETDADTSPLDPAKGGSSIPEDQLPHCPRCNSLLRPGVVWFNEPLSEPMLDSIDAWIDQKPPIDLMLVIGTTATVSPASSYISQARRRGARIAVINMESDDLGAVRNITARDWMFQGDAGHILPMLFEGVIGDAPSEDT